MNKIKIKVYFLRILLTLFIILTGSFLSLDIDGNIDRNIDGNIDKNISLKFMVNSVFAEDEEKSEETKEPVEEDAETKKKKEEAYSKNVKVVLDGLEKKRKELKAWEQRLNNMSKKLEELKSTTEEKIENNTALLTQIKTATAQFNAKKSKKEIQKKKAYEAEMSKLSKLYAKMKPKKAAAIVNNLDLEIARAVFSRMRATKATAILSFVNVDRAVKISERLASKKQ